jgi:hypothetical protein
MHFSVLIIGENPELQLDPYWELDLSEDEIARDYRAEFLVVIPAARLKERAVKIIDIFRLQDRAEKIATGSEGKESATLKRLRAALKAGRLEEILAEVHGGYLGPQGDWGYYANPHAKWDWFLLGGRWQGSLRLLPGKSGTVGERSWTNMSKPDDPGLCDQALCGDIDWPATRSVFTPFAVIKDGEWYEQGDSGWFDSPTASTESDEAWSAGVDALLKGVPPETLISVFDCHI